MLVKVPNAMCWIEVADIVLVRELKPSTIGDSAENAIPMVNFEFRMADGKIATLSSPDRKEVEEFLNEIGVEGWTA